MTDQLTWRLSSFTGDGDCVEIAPDGDDVLVRNSNNRAAGTLRLTRRQFGAWLEGCAAGEFDDLA